MRLLHLLALLGVANARLLESLPEVPQGWERVASPAPTDRLRLRIAMTQPNQALFEKTLDEISDPSHPRYGRHLRRDELKAMLRPSSDATNAVTTWLSSLGVSRDSVEDDGEWINFETSVEKAEKLLGTRFDVYRNEHGVQSVRTLRYSVPEQLHQYVDMIQPTTRFSQLRPAMRGIFDVHYVGKAEELTENIPKNCSTTTTPACIKDLYNIDSSVIKGNKSVGFMAFNNFLDEYPQFKDLATFEKTYAPYASGQSFNWTGINGGVLIQNSTVNPVEANLDAQYLLSVGYPVPMFAYSTGGTGPLDPDLDDPDASNSQNEPYLDWLSYILKLPDNQLPHTISTSYAEDEQSSPYKYRTTVCNMIGQLGARGVSVIFGSGDTGVGSACQSNDGHNTTEFMSSFPAACPFVTSVGGTSGVNPEAAVSFSSGGFSNTWARPSYQQAAVSAYLKILGNRWDGLYNKTGRGFPDVAAQSKNFQVIIQGVVTSVGGTSAATPTFAGVVALLNAARLQAGQPVLGFLNPWIYSQGYKGLNDITHGGSTGCTGSDIYTGLKTPLIPFASWNATKGWDPVTGYGTPDFKKLLPLVLKSSSGGAPPPYAGS